MELIPLTVDPAPIRTLTWEDLTIELGEVLQRNQNVFLFNDVVVKTLVQDDASNEVSVCAKLMTLRNLTTVFLRTDGYVLLLDVPKRKDSDTLYVGMVAEKVMWAFDTLSGERAVEDFYFEILIGLYYARRELGGFVHYDLHEKNLMFNVTAPETRVYTITDDFSVTISDSMISPRILDFGRSVIQPRDKKLWNKSDVHHLTTIFMGRGSAWFQHFLKEIVLRRFSVRYPASRDEASDLADNYGNIEKLLREYFGTEKKSVSYRELGPK